eukprot:1256140-Pleurochrysis_carterae.AAC.1
MRTAQLKFNVVVNNAFLRLRLWCSEKRQIKEFDDLCRYMIERHLSKYVSSTRANSGESFFGFAEAHEVTEVLVKLIVAVERYLKPEDLAADSDGSSNSTFSDDDTEPSVETPKLVPDVAISNDKSN